MSALPFDVTALERLNLSPEETLVVHVKTARLTMADADRMTRAVREITGHTRVLVVDGSAELSVLTPGPIDDEAIDQIARGLERRARRLGLKGIR